MLLKTRAPDALSISKKLKTLVWGPLPHFPGFLKHSMFPSYTLAPTPEPSYTLCSSPGLPPPRPCALRSLRGALRPEPLFSPQVVSQTSAASSPRPLPGEQGLLTYPEAGLGSRLGGVSADGGGLRGGAGAAPGPRPADPAVGAARSQAGGGLRRGRDEGRGGTAREFTGASPATGLGSSAPPACAAASTVLSSRRVQSPSPGWREAKREAGPGGGVA